MLIIFSGFAQESMKESCTEPIKLAVQAWSFNKFTFEEAVQKSAKIGFKYIEMYPGQTIKAGSKDNTGYTMSVENRELVKSILKDNGILVVQYGVVTCNSKEEWIQLFEFAKAMGIETINSEPEIKDMNLMDSLATAYNINLAIHNHATGTRYGDPKLVLDQVAGKGGNLGICADNGHWMRSGINPVEALKNTKGRLITMHIKDMSEFNNLEAHTVGFGTGVLDVDALIAELKNQKFVGVLTIENEYNWENPVDDLTKSFVTLTEKLQ
jgi:sugar phosphate isomerase/epimerase